MKQYKLLNIILIVAIIFSFKENVYAYYFLDNTCESVLGAKLIAFLNKIFNYIKILVPVYLAVIGSLDLMKAVTAGSEKEINHAKSVFIKRLTAGIAVYFVPTLLNVVLKLAGLVDGTCGVQ